MPEDVTPCAGLGASWAGVDGPATAKYPTPMLGSIVVKGNAATLASSLLVTVLNSVPGNVNRAKYRTASANAHTVSEHGH